MFKLLTPETRRRVAREYALRRMVVVATALAVVFGVALVGLLPAYVISEVRQEGAELLATAPSNNEGREDLGAWLDSFNKKLQVLSAGMKDGEASEAIEEAIAERGADILLTDFNWSYSDNVSALSIVGSARDRQALLAYEARLEALEYFSEVTLPVSNLAKERNINFQINLSLKKTP